MSGGVECWRVYFSGHVQGVGFRFRTERLASEFAVTGCVRNLPDGRVELVVEGEGDELAAFVRRIESTMAGYIERTEIEREPAGGRFARFEIRT